MEETREALQEKLEKLEEQVKETVQGATEAVHTVTDAVQTVRGTVEDTVETVKETVAETVDTVSDSVKGTVHTIIEQLDVHRQVEEHPWAMMLGAVTIGFVGGRLLMRSAATTYRPVSMGAVPVSAPAPYANGAGAPARNGAATEKHGWLGSVLDYYSEELSKLKGLALGAAGGLVREALTSSAPPAMAEKIAEVVDSVTAKMGGEPIKGPILESFRGQAPEEDRDPFRERDQMGRPVGVM
jgi:ElaB/YqjD/DUF883 family membrane-anchored ribosome-binding protein